MKTKHELFEELLMILGLYYTVIRTGPAKATVKPPESDVCIWLEWNNGMVTVTADEDDIHVLGLEDKMSVGVRTFDVENILIRKAKLIHTPIALALYLYFQLFGILWGARADKTIRDKDPLPIHKTCIEIKGNTKEGDELTYVYVVDQTGKIRIERYRDSDVRRFGFYPLEYIHDPEKITERFFNFFDEIVSITSVGRG